MFPQWDKRDNWKLSRLSHWSHQCEPRLCVKINDWEITRKTYGRVCFR